MWGSANPCVGVELKWRLWRSSEPYVDHGREWRREFTGGGNNGGRRWRRGEIAHVGGTKGEFFIDGAKRGGAVRVHVDSWGRSMARGGGGDMRRDSGQWRGTCASAGECVEAAWHRRRKLAPVTTLRRTMPMVPGLGPVGFLAPQRACVPVRR
jgi:hypothetical protein